MKALQKRPDDRGLDGGGRGGAAKRGPTGDRRSQMATGRSPRRNGRRPHGLDDAPLVGGTDGLDPSTEGDDQVVVGARCGSGRRCWDRRQLSRWRSSSRSGLAADTPPRTGVGARGVSEWHRPPRPLAAEAPQAAAAGRAACPSAPAIPRRRPNRRTIGRGGSAAGRKRTRSAGRGRTLEGERRQEGRPPKRPGTTWNRTWNRHRRGRTVCARRAGLRSDFYLTPRAKALSSPNVLSREQTRRARRMTVLLR